MADRLCPAGHKMVVRQDAKGHGLVVMCDIDGYTAPYLKAGEEEPEQVDLDELRGGEEQQRQLPASSAPASSPSSSSSRSSQERRGR